MQNIDAKDLLAWYDVHKRDLPWRKGGREEGCDPYRVWLAEIMLQQTTVAVVRDYFVNFTRKWPDVFAFAAADDDAVMTAWAGLGYYARARNALKCARLVVADYDGRFPDTEAGLLALPGVGAYTAAAIAAIAFGRQAAVVDGNIERVLARVYGLETPLPQLKREVREANSRLVPRDRPGDFVQAQMDLGAMVCTPKRPRCGDCPWRDACLARARGIAEILPRRAPKTPRPTRKGIVYWLENRRGQVLMRRRPARGLLGGMTEFPSVGWDKANDTELPMQLPTGWKMQKGEVVHIFTHFRLALRVRRQIAPKGFRAPKGYEWVAPSAFPARALPSVMRKIADFMQRV